VASLYRFLQDHIKPNGKYSEF